MSQITTIGLLSATAITAYLLTLADLIYFLPQLVGLLAILFIIFNKYRLPLIYLISLIVNLIVFATNGLNSPLFFLIYFLLFIIAFEYPPVVSLIFSAVSLLLLSQSLNSLLSLIPLFSLILITPIAWFISRQSQTTAKAQTIIAADETNFLLWLNLKFKTGISSILDSVAYLISGPNLNPDQRDQLRNIRSSAKSLLNSAQKLTSEISSQDNEI